VAANHPERTRALVMMDRLRPFPVFQQIPVLPAPGTYDLDYPQRAVRPSWFAFNQIRGLHEQLCAGRLRDLAELDLRLSSARKGDDHAARPRHLFGSI
jgi:hypothetical protein